MDKYFIIKPDDTHNNNLFDNVKDINYLLSTTYNINDDKELILTTPYTLLYVYLSNIHTFINPLLINLSIFDAYELINIIYKFSSFKEFQLFIIDRLKLNK